MTEKNSKTYISNIAKIATDGWQNLLAGMGAGNDRRTKTTHSYGQLLGQIDIENLYRFNGLAKKIVDIISHEMTREWISIENDPDNHGLQVMERLMAKTYFRDLVKWGNLYGGAIIVMGIDDGGMLDAPVREDSIRSIDFLRVYDRYQCTWTSADLNDDPESKNYGEPEFYTIQSYRSPSSFRVHYSRILKHNGVDIPERQRVQLEGWGDSMLSAIYEELRDYGIIKASSVSIIQDFVQTILQIENLQDLIASGQEEIVKKRLNLIDLSRSTMNTILLDSNENYTKDSSSVAGLSDLVKDFAVALSAVSGIPITKLFGQAPAGLNATGEADIRNFYDKIKADQEDELLPLLQRFHYLIMLSRNDGYKGRINPDAKILFNPLWQLNDIQDSEWKYKIAQTDEIYVRNGILSPSEVAVSRFKNGFNPDITIDFESREFEKEEDEPEKQ